MQLKKLDYEFHGKGGQLGEGTRIFLEYSGMRFLLRSDGANNISSLFGALS